MGDAVRRKAGPAGTGRVRPARDAVRAGDAADSQYAGWRYYGFSTHGAEADATADDPPVASSPAIGSIVATLPDDCASTLVNGCVYLQCGNVWYKPQYTGSDVAYVVGRAP